MRRQAIVQGMASTYQMLYRFENVGSQNRIFSFWFLVSCVRSTRNQKRNSQRYQHCLSRGRLVSVSGSPCGNLLSCYEVMRS